jgi:Gly-Xaa carboxypeptidase
MSYYSTKHDELIDEEPLRVGGVKKNNIFTFKKLILLVFAALVIGLFNPYSGFIKNDTNVNAKLLCPIPSKVAIKEHDQIQFILHDDEYQKGVIDRFSKALQIDTVVYDKTSNYSMMVKFHEYLESSFPLVYKTAEIFKINQYGLVFYFPGSDKELKPIMLAAHMDTVPIGDPSDWIENPFSGRFDGEKFYGRGASDCKNLLTGLMEAMELLITDNKTNFKRGVIFAFGFDEEKSGFDGAENIGKFLVEKFGKNSIEAIVDEGPVMFIDTMGDYYSMVVNGEKGYTDLNVEITTPGGHSSNPRDHTSIGMLSKFLTDYEDDMYQPLLVEENPMMGFFECVAEHGKLPKPVAEAAKRIRYDEKARKYIIDYAEKNEPLLKYNLRTSQAIDIINGGDKANSLPRDVSAIINHRITYGNDLTTVWDKATKHGKVTAEKYDIGLTVNEKIILPATDNGNMVISYYDKPLEPAKPAPSNDDFWFEFTGIIKSFYEDEVFPEKFVNSDKKFIITPSIMTGNTDTRHYWDLSDHIFRVQPGSVNIFAANIHGPNEWVDLTTHLQAISFYYNYISHFSIE